jgi:hypothetical protein
VEIDDDDDDNNNNNNSNAVLLILIVMTKIIKIITMIRVFDQLTPKNAPKQVCH